MMFEEFLKLINHLRNLVSKYKSDFERSEALTRYCLVDPFLRIWGWDPSDPSLVRPEFTTELGRPDYALLMDDRPVIYVGVKALGKQEKVEQYINYCITTGVQYFITTDGVKWEVYDTHIPKPLPEKKIAEWDIVKDDPAEIVRRAFVIWRLNRQRLEAITPLTLGHGGSNRVQVEAGIPLTKLKIKRGQKPPFTRLIFPDNSSYEIKNWRDIFIATALWLVSSGKITKKDIPVKSDKSRKRYIINDRPEHEDGSRFKNPRRIGEYYLETNISSERAVKWSIILLQKFGVDPFEVFLQV